MSTRSFLLLAIVLLLTGASAGSPWIYEIKQTLECAGEPIDVGSYGSPCYQDWDGDGARDLIVGQYQLGKIRLYLNENTDALPVFNSWSYMQADGVDITLPYG